MIKRRFYFGVLATLVVVSLFVVGCAISKENGGVKVRLNPNVADKIEDVGEAAVGVAQSVTPLVGPAGGLLAGGLATGLALFKKFKPKLTQFQTKAEMSNTVAGITVGTFETLKKEHPEVWAKCSEKIRKECLEANIDTKVLENFIRGLRGLPAKM